MHLIKIRGSSTAGLLITLAITAILLKCALQSISTLHSARLRASARSLCSFLESTQLSALEHELTIALSGTETRISAISEQGVMSALNLAPSLVLAYRTPLRFYPSGAATPATVLAKLGDETCLAKISLYGRCTWQCPDTP